MGSGISAPLNEVADDISQDASGGSLNLNQQVIGNGDSSESSSDDENKVQRDDLVNPYWIEDRDLRNGPIDFLPGVEVQFWKDLIEKYLEPLIRDVEKEKRDAADLKTLRNQMVFTFFMLNSIFVVVIFLLQQNKDLLFIRWPFGAKVNVTYSASAVNPTVDVVYTYLELEPIGLTFVVMFAVVLIIQIIGMLFHRWGTISQIISTTKLPMCERKPKVWLSCCCC
jgi:chitin synthase